MGALGAARDTGVLQDKAMAPQCQGKGPLLAELGTGRGMLHFHPIAGNGNILLCIYYNLVPSQSSV